GCGVPGVLRRGAAAGRCGGRRLHRRDRPALGGGRALRVDRLGCGPRRPALAAAADAVCLAGRSVRGVVLVQRSGGAAAPDRRGHPPRPRAAARSGLAGAGRGPAAGGTVRIRRLIGRALLALTLATVLAWAGSRFITDRWWWSQYPWWVPTWVWG